MKTEKLFKCNDNTFVRTVKGSDGRIKSLSLLKVGASANGTPFTSEKLLRPYTQEFNQYAQAVRAATQTA